MDSLSDKIRQFLQDAGFEFAGDRASNLELMRYFEIEYGIEVLRYMEEEWVEQQLEREFDSGDFISDLRGQVDAKRRDDFDADIDSIRGRAA
ncbi:MAG: hypothetical protein JJ896_11605 [Rhodothermales bacterium]|nr:hypothetical protein [Rhodothermales bacterium]MBO6780289.1 hypothetical protein [Rhodothermales bacterium]